MGLCAFWVMLNSRFPDSNIEVLHYRTIHYCSIHRKMASVTHPIKGFAPREGGTHRQPDHGGGGALATQQLYIKTHQFQVWLALKKISLLMITRNASSRNVYAIVLAEGLYILHIWCCVSVRLKGGKVLPFSMS